MLERTIEYRGVQVVARQSGTSRWGWTFDWPDESLALGPPDFRTMADILSHGDPPERSLMVDDAWYERVDLGIRFAVKALHAAGIETAQSCEGGNGHAYHAPTIDLPGEPWAALDALSANGLSVAAIAHVWRIGPDGPIDPVWRIEILKACPERAAEQPAFIWHYKAVAPDAGNGVRS